MGGDELIFVTVRLRQPRRRNEARAAAVRWPGATTRIYAWEDEPG